MKITCKVALIQQRTIPRVGGEGTTDQLTLVKLTPVDLPAGDILLGFPNAKIDWHPETFDESPGGDRNRRVIKKETLIVSATIPQGKDDPFVFNHEGVYSLDFTVVKKA